MELLWKKLFTSINRNNDGQSEAIKLIYSYRYASLLITSIFYLLDGSVSLIPYKLAVVVSLYVIAILITDMYVKYSKLQNRLRLLVLCETFIITLLLIPTGGFDSPFIWYALNPVLVAAGYLTPLFCWFNLIFYMISASLISIQVFNRGQAIDLLIEHSYLILVLILITLLVQLLATLMKSLFSANFKQQKSLEHIMSLYQTIEAFTNEDDKDTFFQTITNYTAKLTKSRLAFFSQHNEKNKIYTNVNVTTYLKTLFKKEITINMINREDSSPIAKLNIADRSFCAVPIKSSTQFYGILGIELHSKSSNGFVEKQLTFLAELSAIILGRFSMEEANDTLLLLEERNRIANEIHDSVSQRLFSINCALHMLKKNWSNLSKDEATDQLNTIGKSANKAMRELRQSIYSLSSQKSGEKIFFKSISSYLTDLSKLNDIKMNINLFGDEEILPSRLKKSIYRVICEATGNAVKHGKSSILDVNLEINSKTTKLVVKDNGVGLDSRQVVHEGAGLGLNNMKNLIQSLGGSFVVQSKKSMGTKVEVEIPISQGNVHSQGGIA